MNTFIHDSALEIRVEKLHKSFGTNHVLQGVDLSIPNGEMIAIVGGSGCGKTVLLELIIGNMRHESGRILLADHESEGSPLVDISMLDQDGMDRLRVHWAVVFQRNALLSGTVADNISLALEVVKGFDGDRIKLTARTAIQAVGLNPDEVLHLQRDELSGGMAKRISIARALAMDPLLVFYDEPTTGLDPEHAELIQDLIFNTHQKSMGALRRTTVIVTHDKDLLRRLHPRIAMLHNGKVFFDGSYELFRQSESEVIRPYFELMPALNQRRQGM